MSDRDPVSPTKGAFRKIKRATVRILSQGERVPAASMGSRSPSMVFEGELTSDLAAPSDVLTGATTATAKRWIPTPGTTASPIELQLGDEEFTLVNRSDGLTATTGTHVIWLRVGLEWRIIWADC